jgi:hypothetical protein
MEPGSAKRIYKKYEFFKAARANFLKLELSPHEQEQFKYSADSLKGIIRKIKW